MITGSMSYSRWVASKNTNSLDLTVRNENVSLSNALLIPGLDRLNPNKLFAQGQPGGWPDPYDLTRMWQDDAGTTPMTLANLGTGVGRCITKGNAITLTQANAADRPVWGRHPVSWIRNLLERTEELTNAYWRVVGATVASSTAVPPAGISAAFRVQETAVTSEHRWENNTSVISTNSGSAYTITIFAQAQERSRLRIGFDNFANIPGRAFFDLSAGTVDNISAGTTASITNAGGGWYRCRVTATAAATATTRLEIALVSTGTTISYLGDIANGVLLTAPQVELAATSTTYQRVTNRFDITEVGSPSLYYFDFNGVSQAWTSNATVNFSTTNRMTIWGGIHKRSDTNAGRWCSLGVGLPVGGFTITAPPNAAATSAGSAVRGTTATAFRHITIAAPATYTQSVEFNLAGATNPEAIRHLINGGGTVANSGNIPGGGNFANAVLQFGRDGASTDPFNGRLYTAIIAGAAYDSRTVQRFAEYTLKPRRLITA